jgi:hypothetical protein
MVSVQKLGRSLILAKHGRERQKPVAACRTCGAVFHNTSLDGKCGSIVNGRRCSAVVSTI